MLPQCCLRVAATQLVAGAAELTNGADRVARLCCSAQVHTLELAEILNPPNGSAAGGGGGDPAFASLDAGGSGSKRTVGLAGALAMATGSQNVVNAYSYHQADVVRAAKGPQSHPTSAALYSIWRRADADGNGFLSASEIKSLNSQLNVKWNFESVWMDIQEMYQGNPDEKSAFVSSGGQREIGFVRQK